MKFKYFFLSIFIFSSSTYSFSRGDGGASGGGLDISVMRMAFFYSSPNEVHIYDMETGTEVIAVAIEELDRAIDYLEQGAYLLVYLDSKGHTIEQTSLLKE